MDISKSGSRLALGRNDGFVYVYSLVAEEFEELREEDDDEENVVVLVDDLDVAGGDLGIRRTRSSSNINNQNHNANNGNNPKSKRNRLPSSSSSSPTSSSNQTHPNPCRHHNHALTEPPRLIINLRHEAEIVETAFNEAGDRLVAVSRDGLAKIWRFDVTTTTTNGGGGVLGWVALDRKVLSEWVVRRDGWINFLTYPPTFCNSSLIVDLKKAAEEYSANNHSGANVKFQELFTEGHHIDDDEEEGNVVGGGYNVDDDNSPPPLPPLLPLVNDHPVSSAGSSSRPALLIPPLPQARPTPLQDVFQPPQPLPAYHQDPAVMIAGGGAIVEDDDSFSVVRLAWTCDDRFVLTSSDSCIRVNK